MRLLVTGASGLLGSNVLSAAAQQSWSALGTWRQTPIGVLGARTAPLDMTDRHACVALAEELEPDVVVHAAAASAPGRLEREPHLAELNLLGTENTLAAARAVRARYVLISCDLVFSGLRPSAECWEEEDRAAPINALGRSLLACERLVQRSSGDWLITRPADVYGVNLSIPVAPRAHLRHVWERSGPPLRWVAWLRAGQALAAPPGIRRSPTYAWDYAQRLCDLIAQECTGLFNTAGPTILGRLGHLRLLARAFGCDMELVQEGSPAAFLRVCEGIGFPPTYGSQPIFGSPPTLGSPSTPGSPPSLAFPPLPANTALCDSKASFVLGCPAVDPFTGHRLMRRQLEQLLGPLEEQHPTTPFAQPSPAPFAQPATAPGVGPSPTIPLRAHGALG